MVKETLLASLSDTDPNVVNCSIRLAGIFQIVESTDKIIHFLTHKNWQIRQTAVVTLGELRAQKAKPFLVKIVGGEVAGLRQRILTCAGLPSKSTETTAGEQRVSSNKEGAEVWQVKKAAAIALSKIDPEIAETPLLKALDSANTQVAIAAMTGLAAIESEGAGERIMPFLDNKDLEVRKAAIICLGNLHVKSATTKLCELLEDEKPLIRKEAVIALNHIKEAAVLPAIVARMKDPAREVRAVAALALGNTGMRNGDIMDGLKAGIQDQAWEVRQAAVNALANLKATDVIEDLIPLLTDQEEAVRKAASLALLKLEGFKEQARYD